MPLTYFRPRGDIKSNWELANPILKLREMGLEWETTVGVGKAKIKFGDGVTAWNNLNYAINVESSIQSDTKSNWTSNNPVLGKGEMGLEWETTVGVGEFNVKVGDGTTAWNDLDYGLTSDITNKEIKSITTYSGGDENPVLTSGDTLSEAAGKLNKQQDFLKNTLGYERLAAMAETLGGLSNDDFMGVMEKLNSIKFDKSSVYNGTDSTSTSLAASANALKTVKDLTDTNTTAISQLNSDMPSLGTVSPAFDGNNIDDSSIIFYRIDVDNWAAMGCNSAGIPIMAYGTNQSDKTVYQFNRNGISINDEIKLLTNADISYGNLGAGNFGAVEGRWQKFGQIVTFAGLIRSISGASGNWGTLATTPYTALSSIWFRPLLNTTGNEPVVRDGNINGSNIESWLNSEDNGKYIFFSGTYVCNN